MNKHKLLEIKFFNILLFQNLGISVICYLIIICDFVIIMVVIKNSRNNILNKYDLYAIFSCGRGA
ncbi:hypothetical protein GA702_00265 [Liquorilactobacillus mali]|nr:hypothetical protein [Liquorilactobacillus mali]